MILSLIVPVYNGEKYISECLNSLIEQDMNSKEYEIIVINDGSTDKTNKVLETYNKFSFIRLINCEHKGVSFARNVGLNISKGEYLAFVDGDDFVSPNIYGKIINIIEKNKLDSFYFCYSRNKNLQSFNLKFSTIERSGAFRTAVWRYVFKKDIIKNNNILFNVNMKFCEDTLFVYEYIQCCSNRIGKTNQPLYFYRTHGKQTTFSFKNKARKSLIDYYNSCLTMCFEVKKFICDSFSPFFYEKVLSETLTNLFWCNFMFNINPRKIVKLLQKKGDIHTKDIKYKIKYEKNIKNSLKSFLQYNFRYKTFLFVMCFLHRIFIR